MAATLPRIDSQTARAHAAFVADLKGYTIPAHLQQPDLSWNEWRRERHLEYAVLGTEPCRMCELEAIRIQKAFSKGKITHDEAISMLGFAADFQYNKSLYGRVAPSCHSRADVPRPHFPSLESRRGSTAVQSQAASSPTTALRIVVSPSPKPSPPFINIDRRSPLASKSKYIAASPSRSDVALAPLDMALSLPSPSTTGAAAASPTSLTAARVKKEERRFSISEFSGLPSSQSSRGLPPLSPSQAALSPTETRVQTSPSLIWDRIEAGMRRPSTPLEVDG